MSRVCHFTGKRTVAGRSISRRGKAKYLGGVGKKTTGISKRKFNRAKTDVSLDKTLPAQPGWVHRLKMDDSRQVVWVSWLSNSF